LDGFEAVECGCLGGRDQGLVGSLSIALKQMQVVRCGRLGVGGTASVLLQVSGVELCGNHVGGVGFGAQEGWDAFLLGGLWSSSIGL